MASAPPTERELDAYRAEADRFIAELDEEYYLHFAGLKDSFELTPIYERHAGLFALERARSIAASVDGGSRVRELSRFACEGYLGELTREYSEKTARLQAELEATVDGERIPLRMLRPAIANEPDRSRRERLERARNEIVDEHLNPLYVESARAVRAALPHLGAPNGVELYRRFGFELDELAEQCRGLLESTEQLWEKAASRLVRERVGIDFADAKRWDVPRVFRAPGWDPQFPAATMVPALEATLGDLGIDLRAQRNVHLDLEQRPQKTPRAFCAPIEVPDRVMLVIKPMGGPDDWRALFHEAGHAEHFAHTSPDLAVEERRMGDNAVTEGWAALFAGLVSEPAWLTRRLDFPRPDQFAWEGAAEQLWFVRRYCAKLLYELEFHAAADPADVQDRYVELLGDATRIEPSATDYLADIDEGFYVTFYLRSWAFEAQIRSFLREEFGSAWFARLEAGSLLRELWSEGQRLNADELLREVTASRIEMGAVADRLRETLA